MRWSDDKTRGSELTIAFVKVDGHGQIVVDLDLLDGIFENPITIVTKIVDILLKTVTVNGMISTVTTDSALFARRLDLTTFVVSIYRIFFYTHQLHTKL